MWNKTKRVHRKLNSILDRHLKSPRRKYLRNTDFSIICNNCWAGYVYRRFGLPYLTPTVGLYFFPEDFLKLCSDVNNIFKTESISCISVNHSIGIEIFKGIAKIFSCHKSPAREIHVFYIGTFILKIGVVLLRKINARHGDFCMVKS